jgi:transcriptional regulator with XRE-family HTH domain
MFAHYVTSSGLTQTAWADRIGVSRSYMSNLLNGKKRPSLEVAVRIERETGGLIPASSWVPETDTPSKEEKAA